MSDTSAAAFWTEYTTKDGKKYWYNSVLSKSVWQKPEELKTPTERLLDLLPWKEFTTPDGRKYWHNSKTNQSLWKCPPELEDLLEKVKQEQLQQPSPSTRSFSGVSPPLIPTIAPSVNSSSTGDSEEKKIPDFQTKEEAEEAFINMLKEENVGSDWTWDKCMRTLISHPMYKALKTVVERKEAFEKYIAEKARSEREEARNAAKKRHEAFLELLKSCRVDGHSRYSRVAQYCSDRPEWKAMMDDRERLKIFDDYVYEVRKQEKEKERAFRNENLANMRKILSSLNVTESTTWKEFYEKFQEHEIYKANANLHTADLRDLLSVFEDAIKQLESAAFDQRKREKEARIRSERKHRDAFRQLLNELKQREEFDANTKWKELFLLIKEDERFLNILGQYGSTPMEIYRDYIVDMEECIYRDGKVVQNILRESGFIIRPDLPYEKFFDHLKSRRCAVKDKHLKVIFEVLIDKAKTKEKENQRRHEKKMKYLWNDFKYYIKKSGVEVTKDTSLEIVLDIVKRLDCDRETIKELYQKYKKRLEEDGNISEPETHEEDSSATDRAYSRDRNRSRSASKGSVAPINHYYAGGPARPNLVEYQTDGRMGGYLPPEKRMKFYSEIPYQRPPLAEEESMEIDYDG